MPAYQTDWVRFEQRETRDQTGDIAARIIQLIRPPVRDPNAIGFRFQLDWDDDAYFADGEQPTSGDAVLTSWATGGRAQLHEVNHTQLGPDSASAYFEELT